MQTAAPIAQPIPVPVPVTPTPWKKIVNTLCAVWVKKHTPSDRSLTPDESSLVKTKLALTLGFNTWDEFAAVIKSHREYEVRLEAVDKLSVLLGCGQIMLAMPFAAPGASESITVAEGAVKNNGNTPRAPQLWPANSTMVDTYLRNYRRDITQDALVTSLNSSVNKRWTLETMRSWLNLEARSKVPMREAQVIAELLGLVGLAIENPDGWKDTPPMSLTAVGGDVVAPTQLQEDVSSLIDAWCAKHSHMTREEVIRWMGMESQMDGLAALDIDVMSITKLHWLAKRVNAGFFRFQGMAQAYPGLHDVVGAGIRERNLYKFHKWAKANFRPRIGGLTQIAKTLDDCRPIGSKPITTQTVQGWMNGGGSMTLRQANQLAILCGLRGIRLIKE